jgi:hypothetical protein
MPHQIFSLFKPALLGALLLVACSNSPEPSRMPPPVPPPAPEPVTQPAVAPVPPAETQQPAAPVTQRVGATKPVQRNETQQPAAPVTHVPAHNATLSTPSTPAPPATSTLHDAWDNLLKKHVSATGKVHYKGFKADKAELDAYLKALSDNPPADTWSRAEKMSYWINAYNAFTIDLIVDNYPVTSIMNLDGGKTWEVQRIALGGKKYSLNQIENDILRPQFQDARIHFAVNCAARSCPPLLNRAYTPENLTRTLEQRTRQFINDPKYNTLSAEKAQVSKIFEWYATDFGDLRTYLNKYAAVPLSADAAVVFGEYDWGLNE